MLDSVFFYGVVAALVLLVALSPILFFRLRGTSAHIMKSASMMESRVYRAVAEKYGVAPSLVAECTTPEGEAIIGAMTRCDRCGSIEECHHFFEEPGRDIDEAREFCPNADLFIDLAEKLRRKEAGEGQA
jgi:hypothetical protein